MVGADALVQSGFSLGVGAGHPDRAAALRGGLGRRHSGLGLRLRHNLGGLSAFLDELLCGLHGLHGLWRGGRLLGGGTQFRLRDLHGAGRVGSGFAGADGAGLGRVGLRLVYKGFRRARRWVCAVLPVAVGAEMAFLLPCELLPLGLALGLAALDFLQHGATLGGCVARAARRDDDCVAVGGRVAGGRSGGLRLHDGLFLGGRFSLSGRLAGLHGGDGLLDLGTAGTALGHAAGRLDHFFGDVRDDQRLVALLTPAAIIRVLLHWQGAVPPLS